jgi:hypothetical protein
MSLLPNNLGDVPVQTKTAPNWGPFANQIRADLEVFIPASASVIVV